MQEYKKWLMLNGAEQLEVLNNIRDKMNVVAESVEKDWWVTQTLRLVFTMDCVPHLVFKGGTSLSKAWGLIDRFSEDIDLALDRKFLGFDKEMTGAQVSKLRKKSFQYISTTFFEQLKEKFTKAGFNNINIQLAATTDNDQDPLIIEVNYKSILKQAAYIQPRVLVEAGSRSMIDPFTEKSFCSLVGEHFKGKEFADVVITIPSVNPERTFLEKIFLLHEEFQKPEDKIRVDRLSRHLYDIEKMMDTPYAEIAIENMDLYNEIVEHRRTITPLRGIDYDNHSPDKINFIPPDKFMSAWKKDYETMQESMIYKPSLPFDKLIERLKTLKAKINQLC